MFIVLTNCRVRAASQIREEHVNENGIEIIEKGAMKHSILLDGQHPRDVMVMKLIRQARALKQQSAIDSPYVFVNQNGHSWSSEWAGKSCKRQWRREGLIAFRLHEIRNAYATAAGEMGMSPDQIRAAMRHRSRDTALIYQNDDLISQSAQQDIFVKKLSKILASDVKVDTKGTEPTPRNTPVYCCPEGGFRAMELSVFQGFSGDYAPQEASASA